MISIQIPHIAVAKVKNGFLVQWQSPAPKNSTQNHLIQSRIAVDNDDLLALIDEAAEDVERVMLGVRT